MEIEETDSLELLCSKCKEKVGIIIPLPNWDQTLIKSRCVKCVKEYGAIELVEG